MKVGELGVGLFRQGIDVGIMRLDGHAEVLCSHHQLLWVALAIKPHGVEAGVAREGVFRAQQERPGWIERLGLVLIGRQPHRPQLQVAAPAKSACRVHGGRAVRGHLPDVIAVIQQNLFVVARPAANAIGSGRSGRVVFLVPEPDVELCRQVDRFAGRNSD